MAQHETPAHPHCRDGAGVVLAIGLGNGASMTRLTVLHVMRGNPLPGRSTKLFVPMLDPQSPEHAAHPHTGVNGTPGGFTWADARNLLRAGRADRQVAFAPVLQTLCRSAAERSRAHFPSVTSNPCCATGLPSSEISATYLPSGQRLGFCTSKVVMAGPLVVTVWLRSLTSTPLPSR